MKNKKSLFSKLLWSVAILQLILLAGCQKYDDKDFGPGPSPSDQIALKSTGGVMSGDTIKAPANLIITIWAENLPILPPGYAYVYSWDMGDGTPLLTTPRVEHKYSAGLYHLVVTITNPLTGTVITKMLWMSISPLYGQDNTIRVISSTPVSGGGYDYELGFLASTVAGFVPPPYTTYNVPFVTGTFCGWQTNPPPPNPDYTYIDGNLYLVRHIVFANYTPQDLHFGQGTNWSYNPNSIYWVSTGGNNGKYVIYPLNGQIYNFPPGTVYVPGEDGDPIGGLYPPTIRDSLMFGSSSQYDSLRLFVNYQEYANGVQPFITFTKLGVWLTSPLHIISGIGWGYYTVSVADIILDNSKLYFKFGPSFINPATYGDMTQSKFYIPESLMCGLQVVPAKSGWGYTIQKM